MMVTRTAEAAVRNGTDRIAFTFAKKVSAARPPAPSRRMGPCAGGESKARLFEVYGYAFLAHKSK